jgi:glyoxylase-like metal-dependent hydrolase (beta-lactamase superfamily II)
MAYNPLDVPFQVLEEGDEVSTSHGELVALEVPGHTRDHLAFQWKRTGSLFVGDLLLGRGDTTWIGEYLGCMGDYLASLDRVEALEPSVIYPGHGPPLTSPGRALGRFRRHRLERLEQVRVARLENPEADSRQLAVIIYGGEIPEKLLKAATASVDAALFHLGRPED